MENKQTAVQWLIEELVNQKLVKIDKLSTYYWYKSYATTFELLCENARRMEKEQIMDAYSTGADDEYEHHVNLSVKREDIDCEKYYKETYGR